MNYEAVKNAMAQLSEDELLEAVRSGLENGDSGRELFNALQEGMAEVGTLFEEGEYFVGDLIYAGEIMNCAVEILSHSLTGEKSSTTVGRMILCTVKNDLHDIGKNVVRSILEANGFEVLDLGIDVSPETIVETAKRENIRVIALSGVLTLSLDSMKATVEAFKTAGMRDEVKIIVGGAPVNDDACRSIGADAWASSPQRTAEICRLWL